MQETAQEILSIFKTHGSINYGERCSVNSHSVQAGLIAQAKGLDEELILAAFLHDIGHLYPLELKDQQHERMGAYGMEAHDKWGEDYLKEKGFSKRLIATVRNHVDAKRYLCFADPTYHHELSEASKKTLEYQGGPMDNAQAEAFRSDPFFEESIGIRMVDDEAKEEDFDVTEAHWEYFGTLLEKYSN